jgi:hypothetical protein
VLKKLLYDPGDKHREVWLIALILAITLGASACAGLPSNALTPTPTTLMGFLPPNGPSTEIAAGTAVPGTAEAGKVVEICALITRSEAEAVLDQPVTAITPGMDTDSATGVSLNFCTYLGSGLAVVVSREDLGSPEAAKRAIKQDLAKMLSDSASTTIPQDGGPGDQAYWSTSVHAAQFTVLKGSSVFSILLGGNIGDPAAHKAALLNLAASMTAGR